MDIKKLVKLRQTITYNEGYVGLLMEYNGI